MSIIKYKLKNDIHGKIRYISESSFDESTMIRLEETEEEKEKSVANLKDMLSSRKAPGIVTSTGSKERPSLMHNGKIDAGAVGNLLDVGLDGAKKRAVKRNKVKGSSFQKHKILRRIRIK